MKKIFFALLSVGGLLSCNNDVGSNPNTELIGNWKLIEVIADPGGEDGGTFSSVESEKIITFKRDGTITSNGNLCDIAINSNQPTSGTYSASESTFNSSDCINSNYNFAFEHIENILIITYPCIELCKAKYIKE